MMDAESFDLFDDELTQSMTPEISKEASEMAPITNKPDPEVQKRQYAFQKNYGWLQNTTLPPGARQLMSNHAKRSYSIHSAISASQKLGLSYGVWHTARYNTRSYLSSLAEFIHHHGRIPVLSLIKRGELESYDLPKPGPKEDHRVVNFTYAQELALLAPIFLRLMTKHQSNLSIKKAKDPNPALANVNEHSRVSLSALREMVEGILKVSYVVNSEDNTVTPVEWLEGVHGPYWVIRPQQKPYYIDIASVEVSSGKGVEAYQGGFLEAIEGLIGLDISDKNKRALVGFLTGFHTHPFKNYLKSLPPASGQFDIFNMVKDIWQVDDPHNNRSFGYTLLELFQYAWTGHKGEVVMPEIIGPEGVMKSSWFQALFYADARSFGLVSQLDPKTLFHQTKGKICLFVDEIDSMSKSHQQNAELKRLLSGIHMEGRNPYAQKTSQVDVPVLVSAANTPFLPVYDTDNRRYEIIQLNPGEDSTTGKRRLMRWNSNNALAKNPHASLPLIDDLWASLRDYYLGRDDVLSRPDDLVLETKRRNRILRDTPEAEEAIERVVDYMDDVLKETTEPGYWFLVSTGCLQRANKQMGHKEVSPKSMRTFAERNKLQYLQGQIRVKDIGRIRGYAYPAQGAKDKMRVLDMLPTPLVERLQSRLGPGNDVVVE